jgi:hypothetical protein
MSPDSDTSPNNVVLVGHGISGGLARLEEMKISMFPEALPSDFALNLPIN